MIFSSFDVAANWPSSSDDEAPPNNLGYMNLGCKVAAHKSTEEGEERGRERASEGRERESETQRMRDGQSESRVHIWYDSLHRAASTSVNSQGAFFACAELRIDLMGAWSPTVGNSTFKLNAQRCRKKTVPTTAAAELAQYEHQLQQPG